MKKRKNIGRWAVRGILIALIVFWMSTIFGFSSENGTESQHLSDKITIKVVRMLKPGYDKMSVRAQKKLFNQVSFLVRKMGHFGEYAILGMLWMGLFFTFEGFDRFKHPAMTTLLLSVAICLVYAVTDEIHQSFIDGRSAKAMDVCIDTAGGLAGTIFLFSMKRFCHFYRRK